MRFEIVKVDPENGVIFHFFVPGMMGTAAYDLKTSHIRLVMSSMIFPHLMFPMEGIILSRR